MAIMWVCQERSRCGYREPETTRKHVPWRRKSTWSDNGRLDPDDELVVFLSMTEFGGYMECPDCEGLVRVELWLDKPTEIHFTEPDQAVEFYRLHGMLPKSRSGRWRF